MNNKLLKMNINRLPDQFLTFGDRDRDYIGHSESLNFPGI